MHKYFAITQAHSLYTPLLCSSQKKTRLSFPGSFHPEEFEIHNSYRAVEGKAASVTAFQGEKLRAKLRYQVSLRSEAPLHLIQLELARGGSSSICKAIKMHLAFPRTQNHTIFCNVKGQLSGQVFGRILTKLLHSWLPEVKEIKNK